MTAGTPKVEGFKSNSRNKCQNNSERKVKVNSVQTSGYITSPKTPSSQNRYSYTNSSKSQTKPPYNGIKYYDTS